MENPYIPWMNLLALGLIIVAFWKAGTRGRIILLAITTATFLIPLAIPLTWVSTAGLALRYILGIGCYLFIRLEQRGL